MPQQTFTFSRLEEPVFVAGSFTAPPWKPVKLQPDPGDDRLVKITFDNLEEGTYQYKFRIGYDDSRWEVDRDAELARDPSGYHLNNVLKIAPVLAAAPSLHHDASLKSMESFKGQVPEVEKDAARLPECLNGAEDEQALRFEDTSSTSEKSRLGVTGEAAFEHLIIDHEQSSYWLIGEVARDAVETAKQAEMQTPQRSKSRRPSRSIAQEEADCCCMIWIKTLIRKFLGKSAKDAGSSGILQRGLGVFALGIVIGLAAYLVKVRELLPRH